MRAALLIVASVLAAGCLAAGPPRADAVACDTGEGAGPSRDMPALPLFALPLDDVAARLAAALGDPLDPGAPPPEPIVQAERTWATRHGLIEYGSTASGFGYMRYWGLDRHWTPLDGRSVTTDYRRVLADLGVPPGLLPEPEIEFHNDTQRRLDGRAEQRLGDATLVGAPDHARLGVDFWVISDAEHGTRSQFTLHRLHELPDSVPRLDRRELERTALARARCELEARGLWAENVDNVDASAWVGDDERWFVAEESLAVVVRVQFGEGCTTRHAIPVYIDAARGSVLAVGEDQATCVE